MKAVLLATAALLAPLPALAQDHSEHTMPGMDMPTPAPPPTPVPAPTPAPAPQDHAGHAMPGMEMPAPAPAPQDHSMHDMGGMEGNDAGFMPAARPIRSATGSGTSLLPVSDRMRGGFHVMTGNWMLMAMGSASLAYTDQGGPRGDDATYTANMAMFQAVRSWGDLTKLTFDAMLSLDAVNGQRGYPNLFATGETAHGQPLVDRQHPHDLFMELTARLDFPLGIGGGATGFVYGGPVGEPALGPAAFVHRKSARYLPLSPISHHWFDSTHISYGVVTGGVTTSRFQIEASAFRGREPDENRWDIESPKLDSWSVRASWTPSPLWVVQVSHGRLKDPEEMHAGQDENRTTASVQYGGDQGLSAMLAFSAKDRVPGDTLTAWIAEANWDLSKHHSLFGRIENVANDELFPDHSDPLHDTKFRVTRFEGGYAYRIPLSDKGEVALGGSLAAYAKPAALDAAYGKAPISYTLFARLGLGM